MEFGSWGLGFEVWATQGGTGWSFGWSESLQLGCTDLQSEEARKGRCHASMVHLRQSRPDSGIGEFHKIVWCPLFDLAGTGEEEGAGFDFKVDCLKPVTVFPFRCGGNRRGGRGRV